MKTVKIKISAFLLTFLFVFPQVFPTAAAETSSSSEEIIDSVISFNLQKTSQSSVQNWIDNELSVNFESPCEWYVLALSRLGGYDFSVFRNALLEYLSENEIVSASSRQKYALVLAAVGYNGSLISDILDNSVGQQGIMSLIFAMHLMNNGYECANFSLPDVKNELLSCQLDDGGWAVTGTYSDIDATAMTIQALAPYYESDSQVNSAINKALGLLSSRQNEDGDYSSYGTANPESTAQVLIALSAVGIDAKTDTRFIKNGNSLFDGLEIYRLDDGSYCHKVGGESNGTATVQVFCAAAAYSCEIDSDKGFYVFGSDGISEPDTEETVTVSETATVTVTENVSVTLQVSETKSVTQAEEVTVSTDLSSTTDKTVSEPLQNEKTSMTVKILIVSVSVIVVCAVLIATVRKKHK